MRVHIKIHLYDAVKSEINSHLDVYLLGDKSFMPSVHANGSCYQLFSKVLIMGC